MPEIKEEELMNPGFNGGGTVVLTGGGGTIHVSGQVIVNSPRPIRNGEVLYDIDGCLVSARGEIVGYR